MDTEEKPAKPEGVNSEAAQPAASGLKVVESYTPRLRSGAEGAGQTMIDPLTKRVIPVEQANEHMRIELMDPMWKKQTAVRHERDATTNLASGAEMSDTIHRMRASQEKELGLKRAQPPPAQEIDEQEIDEQLKRQRMRAMGIPPPPPPAPAVPAAVSAAVSAPAMPAAPAALSGAAAPPKPPMAGMPIPPVRAPVPGMPAMPGMPMPMPGMPAMPMPMPGIPNMPMPNMPMPSMPGMPAMPAMPVMPAMPMPTMGGTGESWVGW